MQKIPTTTTGNANHGHISTQRGSGASASMLNRTAADPRGPLTATSMSHQSDFRQHDDGLTPGRAQLVAASDRGQRQHPAFPRSYFCRQSHCRRAFRHQMAFLRWSCTIRYRRRWSRHETAWAGRRRRSDSCRPFRVAEVAAVGSHRGGSAGEQARRTAFSSFSVPARVEPEQSPAGRASCTPHHAHRNSTSYVSNGGNLKSGRTQTAT